MLTFGEKTERGDMRIYYVYPEEFPEVYEVRAERELVAERALQEVIAIIEEM